jgi:hypothetical protein
VRRLISAASGAGGGRDENAGRRLRALLAQLDATGRCATASGAWHDYEAAVLRRLTCRAVMNPAQNAGTENPKNFAEDP